MLTPDSNTLIIHCFLAVSMSLINKHEMAEKKVAANRRNQRLSHGPATAEGKARIGAAHLRHGFCAKAQCKLLLQKSLAGPSVYELATEFAPSHADALLMRRWQDANIREVRRLTHLPLKIQRREGKLQASEASDEDLVSHDLLEKMELVEMRRKCPSMQAFEFKRLSLQNGAVAENRGN